MKEKIVHGPWTCRMPLIDFYQRADQYLAVIIRGQKSLLSSYKLLRAGKKVYPGYYKQITDLIYQMNEAVQRFCHLLETSAKLPEALIPFRYLLALELYDLDEQINDLKPIVANLPKTIKLDFQYRLWQLIKSCSGVRKEYYHLSQKLSPHTEVVNNLQTEFLSYS